jgi:N-glycosylase/DNA lyase
MEEITSAYKSSKDYIRKRLSDFKKFYSEPVCWEQGILVNSDAPHNHRIFEELTFCLLTANTSAAMGMKAVDSLRDILMSGTLEELQARLKKCSYRYPNKRAEYIIEAREKFNDFDFKDFIDSKKPEELRVFFASEVKGFGYKEASHFLRNIGVFGLAILDKHILRTLLEYGYIEEVPKSLNKKRYMDIEKKMLEFSSRLGIGIDELDLLLWSMKTGKIMK